LTPTLRELYWEILREYPYGEVAKVCWSHVKDPKRGVHFPKPSDLIGLLSQGFRDKALGAWNKVQQAVSHVGVYDSVAFDDPYIHVLIEKQGGWIHLCGLTQAEMKDYAQNFIENYIRLWPCSIGKYPACLKGLLGLSNEERGGRNKMPRFIGDVDQAKAVFNAGRQIAIKNEASFLSSSPKREDCSHE
jgi:hypothetical protein